MDIERGKQRKRPIRLRVGLMLDSPLHVLGLKSLFEDDLRLEMVDTPAEEMLRDHTLGMVVMGATSEATLLVMLTTFHNLRPGLPVIAIGPAANRAHMERLLAAGAKAFLADSASREEIIRVIGSVEDGSSLVPPQELSTRLEQVSPTSVKRSAETAVAKQSQRMATANAVFTPRQLEVLALLTASHSNREIATSLQIEERTVKSHIAILMRKVGVRNRVALSLHALARGLGGNEKTESHRGKRRPEA